MAKKKATSPTPATNLPAASSKPVNDLEKYEIVTVHRSALQNAPYNPRLISDAARKRLKDKIKDIGLVEPPVWNRRSGVLVGGHQRLAIMDALMGTADYMVRVAAIDVDEKREKELNVFLNNPSAMGEYDLVKLHGLVLDKDLDYEAMGFDAKEIQAMYGIEPLLKDTEKLVELSDKIRQAQELYDNVMTKEQPFDEGDPNFYAVVIWKQREARDKFLATIGVPPERDVDGRTLEKLLLDRDPEALTELMDAVAFSKTTEWLAKSCGSLPPEQRLGRIQDYIKSVYLATFDMMNEIGAFKPSDVSRREMRLPPAELYFSTDDAAKATAFKEDQARAAEARQQRKANKRGESNS